MTTMTEQEYIRLLRANPHLHIDGTAPVQRLVEAVTPAKRAEPEHLMQIAIIAECGRRAEHDPRYRLLLAIPNGGHRSKRTAGKLKAEGVRAGVPDLFLPVAAHGMHGIWLELKCEKNKPSVAQAAWAKALREQGYCVEVVYDHPQHALNLIAWYLSGGQQ